jgi:hypothetical protein
MVSEMSADNGIYIAKFPDGYRVAYAACIENIDYYRPNTKARKKELKAYFGDSQIFKTEVKAFRHAWKLSKDYDYLEYGVSYIGEYEGFV